ncbi:MAG TPA: hypothetical protein VK447_20055 [Myxococcaceae bacterium]|nr:hypothetical protein [Myxococcaceae bacterium]
MAAISDKPLAKKLLLKPRTVLVALNAPDNYLELLGPLPEGCAVQTQLQGKAECVHLFVRTRAELKKSMAALKKALQPNTLLWISYPKKSSKVETDLSRDQGWEPVIDAGLEGVTLVSVDGVWSAMRFKPGA